MTRREAWLSVLLVAGVAVAVRMLAMTVITFPRPEDTAYYVGVARNLVEGRGLVTDAIWSFGTPPLEFPRPAFEVWLPAANVPRGPPDGRARCVVRGGPMVFGPRRHGGHRTRLAAGGGRRRGTRHGNHSCPDLRPRQRAYTTAVFLPLVLHSVLPDSTMPFAAIVLAVCLIGGRIARRPDGARLTDGRVVVLGILLGLAALTRNEAVWLALAWTLLARGIARDGGAGSRGWIRLVVGAAVPAIVVFAPWAVRDWIVFGSPLPGQAVTNAFSLVGTDIFAWHDAPSLQRYLAAGLPTLLDLRWTGLLHNIVSVLLLPGIPIAAIGLAALPWTARGSALRLLTTFSVITFAATTLLFPVSTTWGTFLHASAAIQVLLVVSALLALDGLIDDDRPPPHMDAAHDLDRARFSESAPVSCSRVRSCRRSAATATRWPPSTRHSRPPWRRRVSRSNRAAVR